VRILLVGATGTLGSAIAAELSGRHDLVLASRTTGEHVDITDNASIRALFERVGTVDAIVSAAGTSAPMKPLFDLSDEDFQRTLADKLMGQVNLLRFGIASIRDGGSFTLSSGILARRPQQGAAAISLVNAGLEGFARAAALEAPRGIRVNAVSPPWVSETLREYGLPPDGGVPAAVMARVYARAVDGTGTGEVLGPAG
jgi:NAD(P)-dependent dehydrogenase (short-subunit alcohol dehydrogenase family)